ncbi:MAG: hypothetical protein ACC634_00090 [Hyphomicrobiales bacterium]
MKTAPGILAQTDQALPEITGGRAEILVSVAILTDAPIKLVKQAVVGAQEMLRDRFEFFELLVVTHAGFYAQHESALKELLGLRNLRCLILRDGVGEYRAAVMAATESIGDVVLILSAEEFPGLDLGTMFETAEQSGGSVLLQRRHRSGALARLGGRVLSAVSGYNVDPRLMRSGAHHRAWLNRVVKRADSEVALRFMPRAGYRASEVTVLTVDTARPSTSPFRIWRRIRLASEVLANAPPHMLRLLAGASFLVMTGSLLYFIYAITLYLVGFDLQPGWLTTSLAISSSTAFVSLALGAISIALFQILNLLREDGGDEIQDEMDNTDLFREFRRVNVETLDDT